jgi:DNA polymerase III alpha subunit
MTVRSEVMMPKDWSLKATEYVQEAKFFDINIKAPSILSSGIGFTIEEDGIYFGLNAIKSVGLGAVRTLLRLRKEDDFSDFQNLIKAISEDTKGVNSNVLTALVNSGSLDCYGYTRESLLTNLQAATDYYSGTEEAESQSRIIAERTVHNKYVEEKREEFETILKKHKAISKINKRLGITDDPVTSMWLDHRSVWERAETLGSFAEPDEKFFYEEYGKLRKLVVPKGKDKPAWPEFKLERNVKLSKSEQIKLLTTQAEYLGCYVGEHPARSLYPETCALSLLDEGYKVAVAGQIIACKQIVTKKGQKMAMCSISDGTAIADITIFPRQFSTLSGTLDVGKLLYVHGSVENIEPKIRIIANKLLIRSIDET